MGDIKFEFSLSKLIHTIAFFSQQGITDLTKLKVMLSLAAAFASGITLDPMATTRAMLTARKLLFIEGTPY